jgi:hypothetical protein
MPRTTASDAAMEIAVSGFLNLIIIFCSSILNKTKAYL